MKPMIIDSHQHVFWHGKNDVGLIADMDEQNIQQAWLLSWEIHPLESNSHRYDSVLNPIHTRVDGTPAGIPLEDLVLARDRYPDRFVLGFCPHPLIGDPSGRLRSAARIFDVKVCGEWKFRLPFDDPRCIELYRTAGELGMPVVLHLDVPYLSNGQGGSVYQPDWYGGTIDNLERALCACRDTIFIGHAPGFWREISSDASTSPELYPVGPVVAPGRLQRLLESHTNLFADLSAGSALGALERDPVHAASFLTSYADRLLFARDYYGGELAGFLNSLTLPGEVRDRIHFQNAAGLL